MILTPSAIRIWQTVNLTVSVFAVGLCIGVYGACLVDLAEIYNTSVDSVVYILSTRSAGSIAACLIAGPIFRRANIQLVVMFNVFIGGLCLAVVPICPSLLLCHVACFVLGCTIGLIEVGCNVWLITIWKEKSAASLQFYHFMFGVGAMVSPFGVEPFLGKRHSPSRIPQTIENTTIPHLLNQTIGLHQLADADIAHEVASSDSHIHVPFFIYGIAYAVPSIFMFLSYLADKSDIRQKEEGDESKSSDRKISPRIEFMMIAGLCIYILFGVASEQNYTSMVSVYVIQNLDFSKSSGAYLVSVFWGSFTFSRLVATFMSLKVNPMIMLCSSHVIIILAAIALTCFPRSEWISWSMTAVYAFGVSPFFGNACTWALQYIFLSHNYMAAIMIFVCVGAMAAPIVIGPFIESYPIVFIYSILVLAILMTATAVGLLALGRYIGTSSKSKRISHQEYDPVKTNNDEWM